MNVWRWLGISIFLLATVCLLGTTKFAAPEASGQGKDDAKKVEISANPDKATVKAGETKSVDVTLKRGKDAAKEVTLTAEVDPKDKGVTVKVDPKVAGDKKDAKLTVETTSKADGEYKITIKSKSEGSADAAATVAISIKKAEVVQPLPAGDKLPFNAFNPGKTFYQEQMTKTKQTMTVMGQKVEQKQNQTFMIQWTPKEKDKDGNYVVVQKIVGVKMEIDIGGNKISYDSTLKNPKNPMTDFFEALMKEELTFNITPELTVKSVEGRDKFVKNLIDINPQMAGLLKAILSDSALKKMAEPTWWAYPAGGIVAKDQKWTKDATLELGPIGNYKTDFTFTYKGEKAGKDTIGISTKLTYTAPALDKTGGLPFVIQKADLKGDNGEGVAVFDRTKGRFESTKMKMDLNGTITIDVGNMTTTVTLDQNQDASSVTRDELPADWKAKQ